MAVGAGHAHSTAACGVARSPLVSGPLDHSSSSLGPRASRPHRAPSGAIDPGEGSTPNALLALRARGGRDARGFSEEFESFITMLPKPGAAERPIAWFCTETRLYWVVLNV